MEFSVYGSLRAGVNLTDKDDADKGADLFAKDDPDTTDIDESTHLNNPDRTAVADKEVEGTDTTDLGVDNGGLSRFGIKGSEDFGNGLSAGFHFERGLYSDSDDHNLVRRHENVWIGGGWGKFIIGQQGNPYRNAANWDQSWLFGGNNRYDDGGSRNSGIRYDSANLGPVRFSLMAEADDASGAQKASVIYVNPANARCNNVVGCPVVAAVTAVDAVAPDADDVDGTVGVDAAAEMPAIAEDDDNATRVSHEAVDDEDGIDALIATIHYDIGDVATVNLGFRTNNQESNTPGGSYDNAVISANGVAGPLSWYVAYQESDDNYEEPTILHGTTVADDAAGRKYADQRYVPQDAETVGVFLGLSVSDSDLLYVEYEDSSVDGVDADLGGLDKEAILLGYTHAFGPHATLLVEYVTVDKASDYAADSSTLWAGLKVDF